MSPGKLYLIPVPLGAGRPEDTLPPPVVALARTLDYFIAENAKSARAFLKALPTQTPIQQIEIRELSEHTPPAALPDLLAPLLQGRDAGLVSEAGCPAVADPGAGLVALAQEAGVEVCPLIGPSSLLLALMGSGLSGQNFAFHGYLPAREDLRRQKILQLERDSRQEKRTQLFIETPYRNRPLFQALIESCAPQTRVCVAVDLTQEGQHIETRRVGEWRRRPAPDLDKRPTLFLLQA